MGSNSIFLYFDNWKASNETIVSSTYTFKYSLLNINYPKILLLIENNIPIDILAARYHNNVCIYDMIWYISYIFISYFIDIQVKLDIKMLSTREIPARFTLKLPLSLYLLLPLSLVMHINMLPHILTYVIIIIAIIILNDSNDGDIIIIYSMSIQQKRSINTSQKEKENATFRHNCICE